MTPAHPPGSGGPALRSMPQRPRQARPACRQVPVEVVADAYRSPKRPAAPGAATSTRDAGTCSDAGRPTSPSGRGSSATAPTAAQPALPNRRSGPPPDGRGPPPSSWRKQARSAPESPKAAHAHTAGCHCSGPSDSPHRERATAAISTPNALIKPYACRNSAPTAGRSPPGSGFYVSRIPRIVASTSSLPRIATSGAR